MPRTVSARQQQKARAFVAQLIADLDKFTEHRLKCAPVKPQVTITFRNGCSGSSSSRRLSKPFFYFAFYYAFFDKEFLEYDHIKDDPDIGSLKMDKANWRRYVATIVTHEYAHALADKGFQPESSFAGYHPRNLKADEGGHGRRWQRIYRILRTKFVNKGV